MYLSREGLVNLESHSDFFSPMHPTIRIYDNRIEFQNPGRFIRDLRETQATRLNRLPAPFAMQSSGCEGKTKAEDDPGPLRL